MNATKEVAIFGGGCFWCTEAVFKMLRGVSVVLPGYSGGRIENPTYAQVSGGTTGHAEVVYIEFNPQEVSYRTLLTIFFGSHDPTTVNRQGNDIGTQYRSVIFYTTPEQKKDAEEFIKEINDSPGDARRLIRILKSIKCKVNIIPYNEIEGIKFASPDIETIRTFRGILRMGGISSTLRLQRGADIIQLRMMENIP